MKRFLLGLLLFAPSLMSAQYAGKVFVDTNNNGSFDAGEQLLKEIKVSDGLNVVETTSNGEFNLPGHDRAKFIFLTVPSGYMAVHNHYIRIDEKRASYDFALTPYAIKGDKSYKFVHIADTEIGGIGAKEERWEQDVFEYANREKAAFVIHTGDICYENGMKSHIKLMNTAKMGRPVYYCIGNHDLVKGNYGEELYESIYGPVFYSFDVRNVHYIVTPMVSGDYPPSYTVDEVCRWMKNDLAHVKPGTPIYVFNHDLLSYDDNFVYAGKSESVNLNEYNLKAWIYGHWHINLIKKQGKVYSVTTGTLDKGSIDHSLNTYRVMTIDENGDFTSEIRYPYIHHHLCVASPKEETSSKTITVNTYSSVAAASSVSYSCSLGDKVIVKNGKLNRMTDWTWSGELPLEEKYYNKHLILHVSAVFDNGERCVYEQRFTYVPEKFKVKIGDNWTNLVGNASHSGNVVSAEWKSRFHLAWVKNVGANIFMTSPLVYDGKIYTASVDEDAKGAAHVYALDAKTGNLVWKYKVDGSIKNTIAIDKGKVFAQDAYGHLYALDCEDGSLCWEKQLFDRTLPDLVEGLATKDGLVYAGSGESLMAVDAATGAVVWQNKDWSHSQGTVATLSVSDEVVVGSVNWSALYCNDVRTGKMLWSKKENGLRFRSSSPVIKDGKIYLVSNDSFFILSEKTGEVIVRKVLPYSVEGTSSPLLTDSEIVFGTSENGLVALDKVTLDEKWHCPLHNALVYTVPYSCPDAQTVETSPVLVGNTIYVGASDGCVYAINKENGKIMDAYSLGAPILSSVAVSGNTLLVSDLGGNVYAFGMDAD